MQHKTNSLYTESISRVAEHALSLLVVLLMLMAATLWTGSLFGHRIGETDSASQTLASRSSMPSAPLLEQMGLEASRIHLEERDSASWTVVTNNKDVKGTVVSTAPYAPDVKGFAGTTPLYIYIDESGRIAGIAADDNAETPHFFHAAFTGLADKWKGHTIDEASKLHVDAVTGATFSSQGIIGNVQRTLEAIQHAEGNGLSAPTIGWGKTVAVALVLLSGIVMSWKFRGRKWPRIMQLLLNVGVLGFWCGQFLSLSLLRGWLSNGLAPIAYLPTLLVLGVAILMPFFKRKRHYCSWVCPFGSLQELVGRLPLPKVHCSPKAYRIMSRIRFGAFCLLMFLLWMGVGAKVLDYEPFTAFLVTSAAPAVLVLSAIIVVASCFVPNLWCKCLCPMGSLLDLSEDTSIPHKSSKNNPS